MKKKARGREFLIETEALEDMAEILGDEGIRIEVIRHAGAVGYLMANASMVTNPPKGTAEALARAIADLYLGISCFICLYPNEMLPALNKRTDEWRAKARKRRGPQVPSTSRFQ